MASEGITIVLVVGQQEEGSTGQSRLRAFRDIIPHVYALQTHSKTQHLPLWQQVLTNHLYLGPVVRSIGKEIVQQARQHSPELVWIEKGLHVGPGVVEKLREAGCRTVHFSPDNMKVSANQSRHYLNAIPAYDVHVTTKQHNIAWLKERGARQVQWMGKGFDPALHRPVSLTADEKEKFECDVGFVGHWEPSREELLFKLWEKGYRLKVWGGNWERCSRRSHTLFSQCRHLVGDEYVKALCGAKVNLCLLSKWFEDEDTARSVEIPACGKFMLADRTDAHQMLLREGVEAEFYDHDQELCQKLDYALGHDPYREAIALAGRKRCLAGYANQDRLRKVLDQISESPLRPTGGGKA